MARARRQPRAHAPANNCGVNARRGKDSVMTYRDAVAWLYESQLHGIKLGLDNMQRLASAFGLALESTPARRLVHVAGTNGKGSTCAMIAAMSAAAGLKTALFTSPHLISFRERIQINGSLIPEEDVARGLSLLRELIHDWEHSPTFFELTTALALWWFQRSGVEMIVLETGMGGRLDATNVVQPAVSVLTPIDLDHQHWLGTTLAEIAIEKAGIIKRGVPVVSAPQHEVAQCVIAQIACERRAPSRFIDQPIARLHGAALALAGTHQRWNAALAIAALEAAQIQVDAATQIRGLEAVRWPGRFQQINERLVLDGAHNPAAAQALAATWRDKFGARKATLILGVLADKDVDGFWRALAPLAEHVFVVTPQSPRALPASDLQRRVHAHTPALPCDGAADFSEAFAIASRNKGLILVTGSLFLVGEALAHLSAAGQSLERSAQ
jgi:dihydrofolate synthase/folylpolyglutamate synthase